MQTTNVDHSLKETNRQTGFISKRSNMVNFYAYIRYLLIHMIPACMVSYSLAYEHSTFAIIGIITFIYLLKIKHDSFVTQASSHWLLFIGLVLSSSYWLTYCLMDFMNLSASTALLALSFAVAVMAVLLCLPSTVYHLLNRHYNCSLSLSCLLIIADYLRMHSMLAMPWTFWSNHSFNLGIFKQMLPVCGFFLTGYFVLKIFEMMVNVLLGRFEKDAIWLMPISIPIIIATIIITLTGSTETINNEKELTVNLMQNNHNHLEPRNAYLDWEDYLHKIHPSKQDVLNVSAEGAIRFRANEMALPEFKKMTFLKNSLIGINYQTGNKSIPMMVGTNRVSGNYPKRHLVPFGEYFPLPNWLVEKIGFVSNESTTTVKDNPALIQFKNYRLYPMICYDLFFPINSHAATKESDSIIAIAENTWYRNSLIQPMFIRAAKLRAQESQKPVLLVLNRGPSSHIDADGQIVAQVPYNSSQSFKTTIQKQQTNWLYNLHISPEISILLILTAEISAIFYWQHKNRNRKGADT